MVELVDTPDLGSGAKALQVRLLSGVPIVCLCVEPGLIYLDFPGFFVVYSNMEDKEIYDLVQDLEAVGLSCPLSMYGVEDVIETTTKREMKAGTRSFLDEQTGVPYKSHSNGYVRRRLPQTTYKRVNSFWPLNLRRVAIFKAEGGGFRERIYMSYLMVEEEEKRLGMIARNIKIVRSKLPF